MGHVERGFDTWSRVARTFGVAADEPGFRRQARDLKGVFDRLPLVNPQDLPGPQEVEQSGIRRFEVFPRALNHQWIWRTLDKPPLQTIVLTRRETGEWIFSAETRQDAAALLESMRGTAPRQESRAGGALFLRVFAPTFTQTPWWSWVILGASLVGGAVLVWLMVWTANRMAGRLEAHNGFAADVLRGFGWPAGLLLLTLCLVAGLLFIEVAPTLNALRWTFLKLMLLLSVGWLIVQMADLPALVLQRRLERTEGGYQTLALALTRRALRAFAAVIFVLFVLQNAFGFNMAVLLTGLGIAGLAMSLAGQGPFKNFFGAVAIFMNRPFVVGDWVRYQNRIGEVEEVGLQSTRIRILDGELMIVPNMKFTDEVVENLTLRRHIRRTMDVAVPYDTPPQKIQKAMALIEQLLADQHVVEEGQFESTAKEPVISFSHYGDYYLNIRVYYWYHVAPRDHDQRHTDRGWFSYLHHCSIVNQKLLEAFAEAGIEFAFPTRTLHLTDDKKRGFALADRTNGRGAAAASDDESEVEAPGESDAADRETVGAGSRSGGPPGGRPLDDDDGEEA